LKVWGEVVIDKSIKHEVIIEEGKTTIAGQRAMVVSVKTLVTQQKELERLVGGKWGHVVYEAERKAIQEAALQIFGLKQLDSFTKGKTFDKKRMVGMLIDIFNCAGYGVLKLMKFDEREPRAIVRLEKSTIPQEYEKRNSPVCYRVAGILAGGAEAVFITPMKCDEKKCAAKGDSYCEFEVKTRC
jgi:predicted hydrocarbon binding protein